MALELTVVLKDSERTYRQKFLIYETISMCPDSMVIQDCIKESQKNFQGEPEDIQIKTQMVVK